MTSWHKPPDDPRRIVLLCQRAVARQTLFGMLGYSYAFKILHNVMEYLDGSNPAAYGRSSWVATWSRHYDVKGRN